MLKEELCHDMIRAALSRGGDYCDVFFESKTPLSISLEDGNIERFFTGNDTGVGIRVISRNKSCYAYTNELTSGALLDAASGLALAVIGRKPKDITLNLVRSKPAIDFAILKPPVSIKAEEKTDLVMRADRAARALADKIRQVSVSYHDYIQRVMIVNSEGLLCEDERVQSLFTVTVVASDEGITQSAYESAGGFTGFELFDSINVEELSIKAAKRALMMLRADRIQGGRMPVVISSEAGGTMIHEAIGHGLEADLTGQGLSVYAGKLGERVASDAVTVIDDGTMPGKRGSYRFDDEGTHSGRNVLVENGILVKYMNDRLWAMKDGAAPTGNGRRESYKYRPIPRMTNTYLAAGSDKAEDAFKGIKEGLFVKKMGGGQVNTVTGDFVFDVQEGFLIKDSCNTGQLVRGATLCGNGPEVLRSIDFISSDLGFAIGTCGKDGQGVPVTDALPTIRIPEIVVGGASR
ncbi:TldD/PmbA family protein [Candidatus Magnetomonas plexicatena]|uniref:TldD/PmbA family protein n=1 Tax=Candidatus Magnetomonas plexicatena TaxID=2552947 RepID=UPI001C794D67|nr:TldD/PmbA family protein [Nitrospirales bacterium LBB_01]